MRRSESHAPTDPHAAREAYRLMCLLRPLAEARHRKGDRLFALDSAVALAQRPYLTFSNARGLFVYEAEGGWYCDLVLKEVPAGVANALGIPSSQPRRTRKEAVDMGVTLLQLMIEIENGTVETTGPELPADSVSFDLDGADIILPSQMIQDLREIAKACGADIADIADDGEARLRRLLAEDAAPAEITKEWICALSDQRRVDYLRYAARMLMAGRFRLVRVEPETAFHDVTWPEKADGGVS